MNSLSCYNLKAQQALSETFRVGARGVPFSKGPSRFEWMTDVKSWQILPFLKDWLFLAYLFSDFEYNISFTTFREVPPFLRLQKSWKKNRIAKNRKFHAEDRSGKFSKFLNLFVCCHNVLIFLVHFPKLLLSIEKKDFNFHRNSFYTDNFGLRFCRALTLQLTSTVSHKLQFYRKSHAVLYHCSCHEYK